MNTSSEMAAPVVNNHNLGEALVTAGCLTRNDLNRVLQMREVSADDTPISSLLVRLGLISETDLARNIAELSGLPMADRQTFPVDPLLADKLSYRFLRDNHLLPLNIESQQLSLAMASPQDQFALTAVSVATGLQVKPFVGIASELDNAIERLYGEGRSQMGGILAGVEEQGEATEQDIEQLKDMASEAPVIRLVNLVIQRAVELRASDIHVEPFEHCLKVRYRVDGVLQEGEAPPLNMAPAVISRIKIMAKLNIAERRLPQDGRIELRVQGKDVDIRVSTVPTMHGESVVLRLLNRESINLDFDALGFDDGLRSELMELLSIPYGMLMVTGPTGSGKTTTLYTALSHLNTPQSKLITVEDPVEYQLTGINQIQVKPSIGLSFASALRSIVRQDPDVIMVGEMRDLETARICVQSALTGHIVLSTLHTNDAASSVTRLLEMGVEDYLLTSTLNGVIGQRLVRRLCPHCREPYTPLPEIVDELGLSRLTTGQTVTLYRPVGCEHCGGSGFHGRLAIIELLLMNDELRALVVKHADASRLHDAAVKSGMRTMYDDGCAKALAGLTSIEEVIRVTQEA